MEGLWVYIIPLVASLVIGVLVGRRTKFRAFCRELGEALLATDIYLGLDKPTPEDTEKFRKEWADVIEAGGSLFKKVVGVARVTRIRR